MRVGNNELQMELLYPLTRHDTCGKLDSDLIISLSHINLLYLACCKKITVLQYTKNPSFEILQNLAQPIFSLSKKWEIEGLIAAAGVGIFPL